jgi:RNA polymerase sigma-70 factor, ECF subfamily
MYEVVSAGYLVSVHGDSMTPDSVWQTAYEQGRSSWPRIALEYDHFRQRGERLGIDRPPVGERAAELYLASACSRGDSAAIAILERDYLQPARAAIARVRGTQDFLEETLQDLRAKLFVGPARRIDRFAGSGPLSLWLRAVALRLAISSGRKVGLRLSEDTDLDDIVVELDLDHEILGQAHRESLQRAVSSAVTRLSAHDRNILRMHMLQGLSIDQIAIPYAVHRATVARWIVRIRNTLITTARAAVLAETPGLTISQFESVVRAVRRSQIHLSFSRLLGPASPRSPAPPSRGDDPGG